MLLFISGLGIIIYEKRDYVKNNKLGAIIGTLVGIILGVISFGTSIYLFFFLLPIYVTIYSIVGCAGEDCWSIIIVIGTVLLGIVGMFVGVYISSKKKK